MELNVKGERRLPFFRGEWGSANRQGKRMAALCPRIIHVQIPSTGSAYIDPNYK